MTPAHLARSQGHRAKAVHNAAARAQLAAGDYEDWRLVIGFCEALHRAEAYLRRHHPGIDRRGNETRRQLVQRHLAVAYAALYDASIHCRHYYDYRPEPTEVVELEQDLAAIRQHVEPRL